MIQEGDIAIAFIQQSDGSRKPRPVPLLWQMPGYGGFLICAIFTQLRQAVTRFDELLMPITDNQLRAASIIWLFNLIALSVADIDRTIWFVPATLHAALLQRLATYLITP